MTEQLPAGFGSPVPDTAMMSGSDDGEPGERLADRPLTAADEAVLGELSRPAEPVVDAIEDSGEAVAAAEADSTLPVADGAPGVDPLAPTFLEPTS